MIKQLLLCPVLFSYLYQLSYVTQLKLNYFVSRSRCDYCHKELKFIEMIPIISFLCLKGRSKCCQSKLSSLYLIGELLSIVPAFVLSYLSLSLDHATFLLVYIFLLVFTMYDIKTFTLPLHLFIIFSLCAYFIAQGNVYHFLIMTMILHLFYFLIRHGIGYGDILLFSLLSYLLPYPDFVLTMLFTFICGGIFALVSMILFRNLKQRIPLIPFIFVAFNLTMVSHQYLTLGEGLI
ncbi:prepilin peptidase [Staphylococcus equorum]|uniref:Prepilin peptidase n=1 Tax=Staphylococcus equorum TaxID=246432 RepID=A0A9X4L8J3_9STAP|nr:A24 family peptidase [Staphylococcus equorum]MDG0842650.1 prepilin peptidase [Staphylococcus equorum]MDG0858219.1 prepilin peptidase [Staphylococcus equorum]